MTDDRARVGERALTADGSDEGTTVEGVATPVDGDRGSAGEQPVVAGEPPGTREEHTDADGEDAIDLAGTLRRAAARVDPRRALGAVRADGDSAERLPVRTLRLAISLTAVFGYVVLFGAAVGVLAVLGLDALRWMLVVGGHADARLAVASSLLLPPAAFVYLALYDDADLTRPGWAGNHPPLADAWLLVLGAVGLVTLGFSTPGWPTPLGAAGLAAAGLAGHVALPLWLGRRCLRTPSWLLGGLALLLAPLLPVAGLAAVAVFNHPEIPPRGLAGGAAVVLVGTVVPYAFAAWSPGPHALARRAASALGRVADGLRTAVGRRLGRE